MRIIRCSLAIVFLAVVTSHTLQAQSIYSKNNLFAWCVVPFDSTNRTPAERVQLLKDLGFQSYAYDWRQEHLPTAMEEWALAKKSKLGINAIWIWIDKNNDTPKKLSDDNLKVLDYVKQSGLKTQVWVGFNGNYFEGLSEQVKVEKGVEILKALHDKVEPIGCKIALYNHGDWFGEPSNQVKVIEASGFTDVGIVYNFHHAHEQLDRYQQIVDEALPYLWAVNLNGMKENGPKILPIGSGDREGEMMTYLQKVGFKGQIGILGHVEDADVAVILKQNLDGLKTVLRDIGDASGFKTFK